jgi:putative membrane protein
MKLMLRVVIGLIALLHLYIAWFEMFAWTTRGPAVFPGFDPDLFAKTTVMAANQGLYNAFLAAGLIWTFFIKDPAWQRNVAVCFLLMVFVAGVYGAATAAPRILFVQALPALVGLILAGLTWRC